MGTVFGGNFDNPGGVVGDYLAANTMGNPLPAIGDLLGIGKEGSGRDTSGDVAYQTGQLLQEQFKDWQTNFQPIELAAMQNVSLANPTVLPNNIQKATGEVDAAYDTMGGVLERQNKSLGIEPTAQQSTSINRMMDIHKAEATAGAKNTERANTRQMDEMLLMGGAPNLNIAKATPGVKGG